MQIKIDSNFHELESMYAGMRKQVRFAAAVALTRTVKDAQADIPSALDQQLDKPTDFTRRGTFTVPARKDDLAATLGFKDKQARYMALQIAGGVYQPREAGIRLPGNIQLNAFGNIPKGVIAKLRAAAESGSLSHVLEKRLQLHGNRRKGAAPVQLFYGQPRGKGWDGAPMGIWRRIPPATPGGQGKLVPIVVFEDTPAVYRKRFDMREVVQASANRRFADHFKAEFSKAINTAR